MEMPGRNGNSPSYRFGFNGMEKDDETYGVSGASYDFGARIYSSRLGRWLATDPLAAKFPGQSTYSFSFNSPIIYNDKDGKEPARNQAGTIQQAIQQWRDAGLTTIDEIRDFTTRKTEEVMAVRYVYTEDQGWVDLQHYFGTQTYTEAGMDLLEPASGNKFLQDAVFGDGADKSYYSYEDLPSNEFSGNIDLTDLEGEELFGAVLDHFEEANATTPESAPNWTKIPEDDQDRKRIPEVKRIENHTTIKDGGNIKIKIYYSEKEKLLGTGDYIPQNHSSEPKNLDNFDAANTSLEKQN